MSWKKHDTVEEIRYHQVGNTYIIRNDLTGETVIARNEDEFHRYVGSISHHPDYLPIGDAIHNMTKALGIRECTPCAKKRAKLNRATGLGGLLKRLR